MRYKAVFHAFAALLYRNSRTTLPLAKKAMTYFIELFELQKLETLGRNENRVARLVAAMLGFEKEGVLKRHGGHQGEWVDYFISSVVSES